MFLVLVLCVTAAEAARVKQDSENGLETEGFGLQPNQYISTFFNRMMGVESGKLDKFMFVTPLFCAKTGKWFDVSLPMKMQERANNCIKVTCQPNGDVDGELLEGGCGAADRYVPGKPGFRQSADGLRLLPTGDPLFATSKGEIEDRQNKGIVFSSREVAGDGRGNYEPLDAKAHRKLKRMLPKSASWDSAARSCDNLAERAGRLPKVSDEASFNGCVRSCEGKYSQLLQAGNAGYKNGKKSEGAVAICDKYNAQNFGHHIWSWMSRHETVSESECEQALRTHYENKKTACSKSDNYCAKAKRCSLEALLPVPPH